MSRKTRRQHQTQRPAKASLAPRDKVPLIEHVKELRRRLFIVAACVTVGSAIAYGLQQQIVDVLLRPSHGQEFIYTSPIGGMNFLFTVCLDIGLVVATPIILYHFLAFLRPLMRETTQRFVFAASMTAGIVAFAGILFGYFVGLPSALNFLLHQFTNVQVKPLITIQAYMQFVSLYLLGSALMFQLPLILFIINRIKPLKPSTLFKYERHVIVGAFLVGFIMNPTPNLVQQMILVVPIIIMYQFGIGLIWVVNKHTGHVRALKAADRERQASRHIEELQPVVVTVPTQTIRAVNADVVLPRAAKSAPRPPRRTMDIAAPPRTGRRPQPIATVNTEVAVDAPPQAAEAGLRRRFVDLQDPLTS